MSQRNKIISNMFISIFDFKRFDNITMFFTKSKIRISTTTINNIKTNLVEQNKTKSSIFAKFYAKECIEFAWVLEQGNYTGEVVYREKDKEEINIVDQSIFRELIDSMTDTATIDDYSPSIQFEVV